MSRKRRFVIFAWVLNVYVDGVVKAGWKIYYKGRCSEGEGSEVTVGSKPVAVRG